MQSLILSIYLNLLFHSDVMFETYKTKAWILEQQPNGICVVVNQSNSVWEMDQHSATATEKLMPLAVVMCPNV